MSATTKPTQYGAVMPKAPASAPPSSAPATSPPAEMNKFALLTRPSMCAGVSRCRSEVPTMVHSAAWIPNAAITTPTT